MNANTPEELDFRWAVLWGRHNDFMVYGPFKEEEDAEKWGKSVDGTPYEVVPLYPPEVIPEPDASETAAELLRHPVFRFVVDRDGRLVVCYLNNESVRVTEHALPSVLEIARKLHWTIVKEQG